MAELRRIEGGKKEPCLYCGGDPHPTPLACPRIAVIHIDSNANITALEFRDEWTPDPPDNAA